MSSTIWKSLQSTCTHATRMQRGNVSEFVSCRSSTLWLCFAASSEITSTSSHSASCLFFLGLHVVHSHASACFPTRSAAASQALTWAVHQLVDLIWISFELFENPLIVHSCLHTEIHSKAWPGLLYSTARHEVAQGLQKPGGLAPVRFRIPSCDLRSTGREVHSRRLGNYCNSIFMSRATLLGAPGLTTRSKKLLGAKGIATRSKEAIRGSWHRY